MKMLINRLKNRPQKPAWNAAAKRHVVPQSKPGVNGKLYI